MRHFLLAFLMIYSFNSWAQESKDSLLYVKNDFSIYSNKALCGESPLYNSQTDYDVFMGKEAMTDSDCTIFYESYYNPLSLIGNFYSYEYGEAEEAACGPMGNSLGIKTVVIDTGEEVSIVSLFEEAAIVAAFKNDSWVLKYADFSKQDLTTIKSFADVLIFLKASHGVRFKADSFCILGFENGMAKVRFIGVEYMGYNHYRYLQLGFELPIKKEARELFDDKSNFFLGRFNNGLKN